MTTYAFGNAVIHGSPTDKTNLLGDCPSCREQAYFSGDLGGGLSASFNALDASKAGMPPSHFRLHFQEWGWDPYWTYDEWYQQALLTVLTEEDTSNLFQTQSRTSVMDGLQLLTHHPHYDGLRLGAVPQNGGDDAYQASDGWPNAQDVLHESAAPAMLYRAYQGGLRILVASAHENQALRALWANRLVSDDPTESGQLLQYNDMQSARTQLDYMKRLAAYNWEWMCVVTDPIMAARVINGEDFPVGSGPCAPATDPRTGQATHTRMDNQGNTVTVRDQHPHEDFRSGTNTLSRLAVVLALEMDNLSVEAMQELQRTDDVRLVTPVHLSDNAFGGFALYSDLFASASDFGCSGSINDDLRKPSCSPNKTTQGQSAGLPVDHDFYFPSSVQDTMISYMPSEKLKAVRAMNELTALGYVGNATPDIDGLSVSLAFLIKWAIGMSGLGIPTGYAWHNRWIWNSMDGLEAFPRLGAGGFKNANGLASDSWFDQTINNQLRTRGEADILRLMRSGLLVDVAHMSEKALDQTIALARAQDPPYPVLDTHTSWSSSTKRFSERDLSRSQLWGIAQTGGMIGITSNAPDPPERQWGDPAPSLDSPTRPQEELFGADEGVVRAGYQWWIPRYSVTDLANEVRITMNVRINGCQDNTNHDIAIRFLVTAKGPVTGAPQIVADDSFESHSLGPCQTITIAKVIPFSNGLIMAASDISTVFVQYLHDTTHEPYPSFLPSYHFSWDSQPFTFGRTGAQPEWLPAKQTPDHEFDLDFNPNLNDAHAPGQRRFAGFAMTVNRPTLADAPDLNAELKGIVLFTETTDDNLRNDSSVKLKLYAKSYPGVNVLTGINDSPDSSANWAYAYHGSGQSCCSRAS